MQSTTHPFLASYEFDMIMTSFQFYGDFSLNTALALCGKCQTLVPSAIDFARTFELINDDGLPNSHREMVSEADFVPTLRDGIVTLEEFYHFNSLLTTGDAVSNATIRMSNRSSYLQARRADSPHDRALGYAKATCY